MTNKPSTPPAGPSGASNPLSDLFGPKPPTPPTAAQRAASIRDRALDLAVRWTERHTTPTEPQGVVGAAKVFESYLRGDDTSPAGEH